ncbi:MAG: hypothetical protein AAB358_03970 [Patescibacteria group bacterium]
MSDRGAKTWEPIDFTVYFSFVKWPILAAIILEIFLHWRFSIVDWQAWVWRAVFFVILGWLVKRRFGLSLPVAALAGAIAGFVIGLVVSLYQFFGGLAVWKFFNIISETILLVLLGAAVTALIVYLLGFKK